MFGCRPIQLLQGQRGLTRGRKRGAACMFAEHSRGVRCAVLSQVALETPKVAAVERRRAQLLINESPERSSEAAPG